MTVASAVEVEVMCLFFCFASPQTPTTAEVLTRAFDAVVGILSRKVDTPTTEMSAYQVQ